MPFANRIISKKAIAKGKPIEIGILAQRGCPFRVHFAMAIDFFRMNIP